MEQAYTYARYTAGLDFFSLADHAQDISATEWTDLKNIANNHNQDGAFVTFWGFEWSHSTQGHVAVINTMDYCSSSNSGTDTFLELVTWISSRDGVAFFNHPGRQDSTGQEFKHFSSIYCSKFVGMELWNKNDAFNNYYYNDGYYAIDANKGYFDEAIYHNWKIGASGADDNHRATWGTDNQYRLAVLAPAKTRAAIYDGLKSRRFYSTMDKNLVLYFEINGAPMGSDIGLGTYPAVIRLSDGDYETFTKIDLLKNGAVLYSWTPNSPNPFISQNITTVCGDYFYVRVRQADGNEAISSPIFVN